MKNFINTLDQENQEKASKDILNYFKPLISSGKFKEITKSEISDAIKDILFKYNSSIEYVEFIDSHKKDINDAQILVEMVFLVTTYDNQKYNLNAYFRLMDKKILN